MNDTVLEISTKQKYQYDFNYSYIRIYTYSKINLDNDSFIMSFYYDISILLHEIVSIALIRESQKFIWSEGSIFLRTYKLIYYIYDLFKK
jgi:hypothetical protein